MENEEKALLKELKFFDINNLYQKGSYIDFNIQNIWTQGFILKTRPNNKYDVCFLYHPSDTKNVAEINNSYLAFFGEHSNKIEIDSRKVIFNKDLCGMDTKQIIMKLKLKLKKNNLDLDSGKNKTKNKDTEKNNNQSKIENDNDNGDKKKLEQNENNEIKKENSEGKENQEEEKKYFSEEKERNEIKEGKKEEQNNEKKEEKPEEIKDINEQKNQENEKIQEKKEISTSQETPKKTSLDNESSNSSEYNKNNSQKEKEKDTSQNNSPDSKTTDTAKIVPNGFIKQDKNGNPVNISGYYTFQLLGGHLIDCCVLIKNQLMAKFFQPFTEELFELCLDIIIYIGNCVKNNLSKLKPLMNNRKLIIVSQLYAILASFELVFNNIHEFYQYDLRAYEEIDEKLKAFANICYSILIESQKINALPFQLLTNLIKFITDRNVLSTIENYKQNQVYKVFLSHIENLSENELKNIKNNESMKQKCMYIINEIFGKPKIIYFHACYNSYLINCLKCNNLEKKMNALNDINEKIENNISAEMDNNFYEFFIKKHNILDIFFEESVHEEILKRTSPIFKYMASWNKLDNEILDKLIQGQKNDAMKKILCDVISELPPEKKTFAFNHLIKNLNFDENKTDIEYISRLSDSCLQNDNYQKLLERYKKKELSEIYDFEDDEEEEKEDLEDKKNQNYYGLTLLLDYILKNFNDKKPIDKNNVNIAIESFDRTIHFSSWIEAKDIMHFMDLLFDNIKSNEKYNSVIQSLILIKKLLSKLFNSNLKEKVFKIINEKYNIIQLIINDLIRYINLLQKEKISSIDETKIYEGIYPHKSNIEERLDLIFLFNRYKDFGLKFEKDNLKQLYKLFKPKIFKKEMQKLLNIISKNSQVIEKDIIHSFYNDIIINPDEFDIVNFEDLNALSLIKDLFYEINHDSNTIVGSGKKLRVIKQEIEGLDFIFDILINNKNKIIQRDISRLLSNLCLNLHDYNSDFPKKYWKFFIDKIEELLIKLDKENNIDKLNGIINLIDLIYSNSCNFEGVIPLKDDVHQIDENHELFQIHHNGKQHKDYLIYVGYSDDIYLMRWKCGYYYDIPVNNVVLVDKNKKKYSLLNDNEKFFEIFPPHIYSPEVNERGYTKVNVIQEKNILLTIPGNPKTLIEENQNLFQILIKFLSSDIKLESDIKQKIYNIIKKMPKNLYIEQNIKIFGNKEKVPEEIINKNLNYENIYVLTYFLQCFDYYIKKEEKEKEKKDEFKAFLNNFIEIQNGEQIFINLLLKTKIDYEQISLIQIECITNLINLIKFINSYKNKDSKVKNFEYIHNNVSIDELITSLSELIINILKIKYDEINNYNLIASINNYRTLFINDACNLLEDIISFTDEINSENKTYYLRYLLSNKELFKEIFLYNYIKCKEEKLIEILHTYFIKNIFEDFNLIKIYLEIMFSIDIFKYLIDNDTNGNYFRMLTSIMQKFNLKNLESKDLGKNRSIKDKSNEKNQKENKNGKSNDLIEKEADRKTKKKENNSIVEDKENKENKEKKEEKEEKENNQNKEVKENRDEKDNKVGNKEKEIKVEKEEKADKKMKEEKQEKEEKEEKDVKEEKEEKEDKVDKEEKDVKGEKDVKELKEAKEEKEEK